MQTRQDSEEIKPKKKRKRGPKQPKPVPVIAPERALLPNVPLLTMKDAASYEKLFGLANEPLSPDMADAVTALGLLLSGVFFSFSIDYRDS